MDGEELSYGESLYARGYDRALSNSSRQKKPPEVPDKTIGDSWRLTQIGGGFTFWCASFHTKFHDYKDDLHKKYRRHRCRKCGTVYMSPKPKI